VRITKIKYIIATVWKNLINRYRGYVFMALPLKHTVFTDKFDECVFSDWLKQIRQICGLNNILILVSQ